MLTRHLGNCPADPALGKSINIDFTSGPSSLFSPTGKPTYGSNGAEFTVAKSGDSPLIKSNFYIMFGHVDYVIKAAPGQGIVSSAVLLSDCLDEIDWEWLGGDDTQGQTNYFGKGITTNYNRGAFENNPGNHDGFHTYSVDWTADAIIWSIDGTQVRTLTPGTADAGQYPQTPMVIKVGSWSGGDPSNSPGTIQWAGGLTNYADGPFTMYLKSIHVADYSTGTEYTYSGSSGTWESIRSVGGQIHSSGEDSPGTTVTGGVTSTATQNSQSTPFQAAGTSSTFTTPTVYPWVTTAASAASATTAAVTTSISGLPSGWTVNSSGKVVPPNAAATSTASIFNLIACLLAGTLALYGP